MQHAVAPEQPGEHGNGWPTHAEQKSIGASHIRRRIRREVRVLAGFDSEDDVDCVFGEDRQQCYDGERQCAGDVVLGGFGAPGHAEGGADDCQAIQKGGDFKRQVGVR